MAIKNTWQNGDAWNASDANDVANAVNAAYVKPGTGVPKSDLSSGVQESLDNADSAVQASSVGQASGVAGLDSNGRVPVTQLPNSIMEFQGQWNASTNSPTLANGTGNAGDVYRVNVAGAVNFGAGSISFDVGDWVMYSGSIWQKSDTTDAVTTVAGRTGDIVLTVSDIGGNTTTALGVGSIELGHASDTTVSRSAAGKVAVEGVDLVDVSSAQTLTSKRITPRVGSTASSATPSIDCGLYDQYNITALAAAITGVTVTGTAADGQKLLVRIKDNGTARAISWGSSFVASGSAALPTTTAISKTHLVGFIYDSTAAKWVCVAADAAGY